MECGLVALRQSEEALKEHGGAAPAAQPRGAAEQFGQFDQQQTGGCGVRCHMLETLWCSGTSQWFTAQSGSGQESGGRAERAGRRKWQQGAVHVSNKSSDFLL